MTSVPGMVHLCIQPTACLEDDVAWGMHWPFGEIRETGLEIEGSIFESLVIVTITSKVMFTVWIMGTEVLVYVSISAP
jgi:hypothetical protein